MTIYGIYTFPDSVDMLRLRRTAGQLESYSKICSKRIIVNTDIVRLKMVRTKNLNAASGRKQRIEGIVKNLSAKATASPSIFDEKQAESVSVLGVRERSMDSITNRSSPFETGKRPYSSLKP